MPCLPFAGFGGSTDSGFPWSTRTIPNSGAEYKPQQCSPGAGGYWRTLVPAPASCVAGSLQCRQVPGLTLDAVGYRY